MGYPDGRASQARRSRRSSVYNRTAASAPTAGSREYRRTQSSPSPADAAADADIVLACVGRDATSRDVTLGRHGAFTGDAERRRFRRPHDGLGRHRARTGRSGCSDGIGLCRRAGFGRRAGREERPADDHVRRHATADYAKAEPVMAAYAKQCRLMGEAGAGQLTKMVNQICIAGLVQALSRRA